MDTPLANPDIDDFIFDTENEAKFAAHGISARQVWDLLEHKYNLKRNRKGRRGLYLIIGRDESGNCIAVPIEATADTGIWRPISAWPCKSSEVAPSL